MRITPAQRGGDLTAHGLDRRADPHRRPALAAVAKLGGLEPTDRGARRDRGAAYLAGIQPHFDLDRGIAPAVENLPRVRPGYRAHGESDLG